MSESGGGSGRDPKETSSVGPNNIVADLAASVARLEGALSGIESKLDRALDVAELARRRASTVVLGDGIAMTYLEDGSPMFLYLSGEIGPVDLIRHGWYEAPFVEVALSYLKPHLMCIDAGANVGFYALQFARRVREPGRVLAFEPNPTLCRLMHRTLFHNSLRDYVDIYAMGLSDHSRRADLTVPIEDMGWARIVAKPSLFDRVRRVVRGRSARKSSKTRPEEISVSGRAEMIPTQLVPLDEIVPSGRQVGVVKIDVEHHELQVLKGMHRVIVQSPDIAIVFEKLDLRAGYEGTIFDYLASLGLKTYAIGLDSKLHELDRDGLLAWQGYALAIREEKVGPLDRRRFAIYPEQLTFPGIHAAARDHMVARAGKDEVLFYGPYWFLRRGWWRIDVYGHIRGQIVITIAERNVRRIAELAFSEGNTVRDFRIDHDLVDFQCLAQAQGGDAEIELYRIELVRVAD